MQKQKIRKKQREKEKEPRETPLSEDNEYQIEKLMEYNHVHQPEEKSDPSNNSFEEERRIEPQKISDEKSFESHLPEITKTQEQSQTVPHKNEITTQTPNDGTHEQNSVVRKNCTSTKVSTLIKENWELETIYSAYTVYSVPSSQKIEKKPEEDIPVSHQSGNLQPTNAISEEVEQGTLYQNQTLETNELAEQEKINSKNISPQQQKSNTQKPRNSSTFTIRGQMQPPPKRQSLSTSSQHTSFSSNSRASINTVNRVANSSFSKHRQSVNVPQQNSLANDWKLSRNLLDAASQKHDSRSGKQFERHISGLQRNATAFNPRQSVNVAKEYHVSFSDLPNTSKKKTIYSPNNVSKTSKTIENNKISSKPKNNELQQRIISQIDQRYFEYMKDRTPTTSSSAGYAKKKVTIESEEVYRKRIEERIGTSFSRGKRKDTRTSHSSYSGRRKSTMPSITAKQTSSSQHQSFQHPGKSMGLKDFKLVTKKLQRYRKEKRKNILLEKMGLDQPHLLLNTRPKSKQRDSEIIKNNQIQSSVIKISDDQKMKSSSTVFGTSKGKKSLFSKLFYKSQEK